MIHHVEVQVLILLLIASVVGMAARRLKVPYTLALVVAGLALGFVHIEELEGLRLSADLLMLLFLPPLLFEAALHIELREFRKDLAPILTLAVPGVLVGAGITTLLTWLGLSATGISPGFGWPHALLFASVLAATDPISVLALFKELGVPRRLYLLVEGESLLNDGVAVVVFLIVGTVLGVSSGHGPDPGGALETTSAIASYGLKTFVWMAGGGVGVGLIIGTAASVAARQIDDHLIETTLTTLVAWGSFLLAEQIHASGVLATVSAGMVIGSLGKKYGMSVSTRVAVEDFWEYMAFLANSFVFLLVGLELEPGELLNNIAAIAIAFAAAMIARAVTVYSLSPLAGKWAEAIPNKWKHVMVWVGLKGSLSMVLILTIPPDFPGRSTLVTVVFGAVAFSLFLQGLTVGKLLKVLGISGGENAERTAFEEARGKALAARTALRSLEKMEHEDMLSSNVRDRLTAWYTNRQQSATAEANSHAGDHHIDEQMIEGMLRLLAAEREAIRQASREGHLDSGVSDKLLTELSARHVEIEHLAHVSEPERRMGLKKFLSEPDDSKAEEEDAT